MRRTMLAVLCAVVCACGPRFEIGPPPALPRNVPVAPAPPKAEPMPGQADFAVDSVVTAARRPPDLRGHALAVAVGGSRQNREAALELLPRLLIAHRYTRVLYPLALQRVDATLERGRAGAGDRTVIKGTLHQLALLQAAVPAEHLLAVEIVHLGNEEQQLTGRFRLPAEQMNAYRAAYPPFQAALTQFEKLLNRVVVPYEDEFAVKKRDYEQRGGRYEKPEESAARDAASAWLAEASALRERGMVLRGTPSPERLESQVGAQRTARTVTVGVARVRAILTSLRPGETYWMTEVTARGATYEEALRRALDRVLADLRPSPASAPAVVEPSFR